MTSGRHAKTIGRFRSVPKMSKSLQLSLNELKALLLPACKTVYGNNTDVEAIADTIIQKELSGHNGLSQLIADGHGAQTINAVDLHLDENDSEDAEARQAAIMNGYAVPQETFEQLLTLGAQQLVPTSAASRSGAGD